MGIMNGMAGLILDFIAYNGLNNTTFETRKLILKNYKTNGKEESIDRVLKNHYVQRRAHHGRALQGTGVVIEMMDHAYSICTQFC
eukprot:scaffold30656_cov62-Cyclotella_meneghiniana.AAC.1